MYTSQGLIFPRKRYKPSEENKNKRKRKEGEREREKESQKHLFEQPRNVSHEWLMHDGKNNMMLC